MQPGHLGRFRIRVGDFRLVYEVADTALRIDILVMGDRKEVYE